MFSSYNSSKPMHRRLQFGMRENPASSRRHGSRVAVDEKNQAPPMLSHGDDHPCARSDVSAHAVLHQAATGGERAYDSPLMTIHEVAELLQVPSSWVYEHTRLRCANRIPGIRLGKYWRFQRADVIRWLDTNRKKDYRHAG